MLTTLPSTRRASGSDSAFFAPKTVPDRSSTTCSQTNIMTNAVDNEAGEAGS